MARFTKIEALTAMLSTGMVPVFYSADLDRTKHVVKACYEGGVRAFEFTNRGDFAHEVFGPLVRWAATECPEMVRAVSSTLPRPHSTYNSAPRSSWARC